MVAKIYLSELSLLGTKMLAFLELLKVRLSLLVAFSCAFGYALAVQGSINWFFLSALISGAFLLSGASVTANQILERDVDKLMERTRNRPIPTGRVSTGEAMWFTIICFVVGIWILWHLTNPITVWLAVLSAVLYMFVYTPMKRMGPFAVFVGAIPGALPPLLGWTAAVGYITYEALAIFAIQFIWQFPHFWAIAWLADEDYKRAGFKLLPSKGGKTVNTALQMMTYTLFLIPLGLLPSKLGITGIDSAIVIVLAGIIFFAQTFFLTVTGSKRAAFRIMIGSFLYLPCMWIAFLLDKVH